LAVLLDNLDLYASAFLYVSPVASSDRPSDHAGQADEWDQDESGEQSADLVPLRRQGRPDGGRRRGGADDGGPVPPALRLTESSPSGRLRGFIQGSARFYTENRRHVVAVRDVWVNFRRPDGTQRFGLDAHEPEFEVISEIPRAGQVRREFREFDPRVVAITLRRALDGLATLVSTDPHLDVEAYTRELVAIFDGATRRKA
jgi:hypothetical protein